MNRAIYFTYFSYRTLGNILITGGLPVRMELRNFAGRENGVDVNLHGVLDSTRVPAGERGYHRDFALASFFEYPLVSRD